MGEGLELVRPNIDKIYEPRIGVEAKTLAMVDKDKIRLCAVCCWNIKLDLEDYYFQDYAFDEHEDHKKNACFCSYWVHECCIGKPVNPNFDPSANQKIAIDESRRRMEDDLRQRQKQ